MPVSIIFVISFIFSHLNLYSFISRSRTPSAAFRYGEQRPSPAPTLMPRSKTPAPHPPRPTKTYPHSSALLPATSQGLAVSNGGIVSPVGSGNTIPRVTIALFCTYSVVILCQKFLLSLCSQLIGRIYVYISTHVTSLTLYFNLNFWVCR